MDGNVTQFNRRINYLIEETDAVYHEIAVRLGLSDSAMLILYALEDAGGQIPLTTIYRQTGASRPSTPRFGNWRQTATFFFAWPTESARSSA